MRDKVTDKINDCLDVYVEDTTDDEKDLVVYDSDIKNESREDDIKDDYDKRRDVLYDLIDKGNKALESSLSVATGSMHPRAFEVTGQLIKTMADVAKDLTELQQSMDKLEGVDKEKKTQNVTQNAIFVGSTSELLKTLKENK